MNKFKRSAGIHIRTAVCTKYRSSEVLQLQKIEKLTPGKKWDCIKVYATSATANGCIIRGLKVPMKFRIPTGLSNSLPVFIS